MNRSASIDRRSGFTLVELLLSIALGVLVAAVLAALIHGLLAAGEGQAARLRGPRAVVGRAHQELVRLHLRDHAAEPAL